jgi:hypothetical protein
VRKSDPQVLRLGAGDGWWHRQTRRTRGHHADRALRQDLTMGKVAFVPHFPSVNRRRHDHAPRRHRQGEPSQRDDADVFASVSSGVHMEPARRYGRWRDRGQQQRERDAGANVSAESAV